MLIISIPALSDAEGMNTFFQELDTETKFMLFEPSERLTSKEKQESFIKVSLENQNPLVLIAKDNNRVVGFCGIRRETQNRNRHCASLVLGVLKDFSRKGLGKELLNQNIDRAIALGVLRFELTVIIENEAAINLYKKRGFVIEGQRLNSLKIDGQYFSEYYMGLWVGKV